MSWSLIGPFSAGIKLQIHLLILQKKTLIPLKTIYKELVINAKYFVSVRSVNVRNSGHLLPLRFTFVRVEMNLFLLSSSHS